MATIALTAALVGVLGFVIAEIVIRLEQRDVFVDDWVEIGVAGAQLVCIALILVGLALWALTAVVE